MPHQKSNCTHLPESNPPIHLKPNYIRPSGTEHADLLKTNYAYLSVVKSIDLLEIKTTLTCLNPNTLLQMPQTTAKKITPSMRFALKGVFGISSRT